MGQDQYGGTGGDFTPYQPDATPDAEPPAGGSDEPGADVPYVPYGAASGMHTAALVTTTPASSGRRVLPWVIVAFVLVATCGGGIAGIIGGIAGSDSGGSSEASDEVLVNDLVAGQCLIGAGFATDEPVSSLEIVDCSTAHDAQVLDVNVLDSREAADYDFDDSASTGAVCRPVLNEKQEELLHMREYGLTAFTETPTPVTGDKVACLITRNDGALLHEFLPVPTPEPPISPA